MLRCFLVVVHGCPFGQLFGDYSADGKPWSSWLDSARRWRKPLKETKAQQRACTQFEQLVYGEFKRSRDTRRTARANRHQVCSSSDTVPATTANNRAPTTPALIGAKAGVEVGKKKTPRETQFPHQVPEGVSESSLLRLRSIIRLEINAVAGNGT